MNKIAIAISVAMFFAGVLLGSGVPVDAGHEKPCPPTITPTRVLATKTPTRTPTFTRGHFTCQSLSCPPIATQHR